MKFIFMERKELRHLKTFYYTKGKFFLAFLLKKALLVLYFVLLSQEFLIKSNINML